MTLWFVFCKGDLLLARTADAWTVPSGEEPPVETKPWTTIHDITPMDDGTLVKSFATDAPVTGRRDMEMCPLRQSYHRLPLPLYLKAGKCEEILYWDFNTRFCGVCGAPTKLHTSISKRCTQCGKEVWPQLQPAVITLIHRGDEAMLVHSRKFMGKYYGLVAGFVETGETLEEAAIREIREEVGLEVRDLRYVMSQSWPYPSGLMIGFVAEYVGGDLRLQRSELSAGGWFHKDSLPPLPDGLSVARQIIDLWKEGRI